MQRIRKGKYTRHLDSHKYLKPTTPESLKAIKRAKDTTTGPKYTAYS